MRIRVFAMTCGHLTGDFGRLMEGGEGWIRLPVPAYLIEHPKGFALFDSGMHPDCHNDPAVRVGARIAGLFEFDYRPGEEISARLMAISCDPAKIDLLINSHFHSTMSAAMVSSPTRRCWYSAANGKLPWSPISPCRTASTGATSI
jgi:N-acyl homoserine lactone hydrolase